MLVPKLRFKREDGTDYPEWRYARTDEIAEINPKTSDLPNRFYYMDLGSVSKGAWQEKTITDKDNAPSRANRLASVGDVFFQSVRPYNMGHFFFEEEYEYPVVASTGFIQLRATQEYYNGFIYQLLYEDRFNAEVNIRCTGSNYPAINSESFSDIEMLFPCLEEQQKIADFLSTVDEVIAQSEAEVQNLEQQKKAAMQKIFSQEVRFKREDGTEYPKWEKSKFADIYEQASEGATPSTSVEEYYKNGTIPFVKIEDTTNKYIYSTKSHITEEGLNNCSTWLIPENSVIFTNGATIGNVSINKISVTTKQGILGIVPKQFLLSEYLYYLFSTLTFQNEVHKRETKGTFATIILKSLNEIEVFIPCLEEQQKIADFLSTYDEAISYAKQELDKWKELKKGLLQQMFV